MAFKICYQYDITVRDDADFVSVPMQVVNDTDNTPIDVSGYELRAKLRDMYGEA